MAEDGDVSWDIDQQASCVGRMRARLLRILWKSNSAITFRILTCSITGNPLLERTHAIRPNRADGRMRNFHWGIVWWVCWAMVRSY